MAKPRARSRSNKKGKGAAPAQRKRRPTLPAEDLDWKNFPSLRRFVSERGKIRSRRITGLSRRQQAIVEQVRASRARDGPAGLPRPGPQGPALTALRRWGGRASGTAAILAAWVRVRSASCRWSGATTAPGATAATARSRPAAKGRRSPWRPACAVAHRPAQLSPRSRMGAEDRYSGGGMRVPARIRILAQLDAGRHSPAGCRVRVTPGSSLTWGVLPGRRSRC